MIRLQRNSTCEMLVSLQTTLINHTDQVAIQDAKIGLGRFSGILSSDDHLDWSVFR